MMDEPADATPVLRVRASVYRFGAQVVHDGLALYVHAGAISGFVGASGSGKPVPLRTMLGLRR